jgi:cell division inhibitor SulA
MNNTLDELLQQPGIWRARSQPGNTGLGHAPSGFTSLDQILPGGGWPLGAVTEILHDGTGVGELRLLMPALAELSRRRQWIALVAPPHVPYAPALAQHGVDLSRLLLIHPRAETDALWAVEQALRSGTCSAVLSWLRRADGSSLRRLQLAAEAGRALGLVFRHESCASSPSPAALRLQLAPDAHGARVRLLKCRGGGFGQELTLSFTGADTEPLQTTDQTAVVTRLHPLSSSPHPRPTGGPRRNRRRAAQMDLPLAPISLR